MRRLLAVFLVFSACYGVQQHHVKVPSKDPADVVVPVVKSDAQWRESLTEDAYAILRKGRTERAFTGAFWNLHRHGLYRCAGCDQALFSSEHKFDSGTGWPSFREPVRQSAVDTLDDDTLATMRTEVRCSRCGGHLGHVFDDGSPTGPLRYCINSAALRFESTPDGSPATGVFSSH
jgi:peptide-methionine (R)-S-oxide reductase